MGDISESTLCRTVPFADVMRHLIYGQAHNQLDRARLYFIGLPPSKRGAHAEMDFSSAESACPHGMAIGCLKQEAATILGLQIAA